MGEENLREISKEYFLSLNLYKFIVNDLSMFLSYIYDQNNEDRLDDYKNYANEMLKYTNLDNQLFNKLLDEYIDQYLVNERKSDLTLEEISLMINEKHQPSPIETYILNHRKKIEEKLESIPNTLDKARDFLIGLILAFNPRYYSDQVYDAIILLKDEISPEKVNFIREEWRKAAINHFRRGRPSRIFWISNVEYEKIDAISRYRFKTQFYIRQFEFAFKEVESQLEEFILDTRGSSLGSFDLWLISRSLELSTKLTGIDFKLKGYVNDQHEDGYWRNGSRLDIKTPDIYTTALNALNLLKLSPSKQWKQSGIKGAKWIKTRQNSDSSWSFQFRENGEIRYESDILTTILCLEVLKRSRIDNIEEIIEKGEDWIMNQQTINGMWDDEHLPFPFLTVLILEYFYNKEFFSHQLPLFRDELTPANIIFRGMKGAIEISKNCESEEGRISPKVGAVVIKADQIVLEAYRGETSPGDHAEYIILEEKSIFQICFQ